MSDKKFLLNTPSLTSEKSLKTLVENRTIFSLNNCELNLYETHKKSELVPLKFNDLVVTSMLRGKKIMHLNDQHFDYLPGETVLVPANVEMKIDFPEANKNNPTQCTAIAIDINLIQKTLDFLNEKYPKEGHNNFWQLYNDNYFFYNNQALAKTINKIIQESMSDAISKDILVDLSIQELLVRIIQSQTSIRYEKKDLLFSNSPMKAVLEYIEKNITQQIKIEELSNIAYMSISSFYKNFKLEFGMTPLEYIINKKIKYAKKMLSNHQINVAEVSYASGFEDYSYFIRIFKKHEGITPKQFQLMQA